MENYKLNIGWKPVKMDVAGRYAQRGAMVNDKWLMVNGGTSTGSVTVDVSGLAKGMYVLEIETDGSAGSPTVVRKKVVKE